MNEHVTNETPTEIAGDAAVRAEVAALRDRLAVLEESLRASPPTQGPARAWKRTGVRLAAGALLTVLAGATVVYGADALDALFIGPTGNVGIGTTSPAVKLQVAGSGWFGSEDKYLEAPITGKGVRVLEANNMGRIYAQDRSTAPVKPLPLHLQETGSYVDIGDYGERSKGEDRLRVWGNLEVTGSVKVTDGVNATNVMDAITALQTRVEMLQPEPIDLASYPGADFDWIDKRKLPQAFFYPFMHRVFVFGRIRAKDDKVNCHEPGRRSCELFKLPQKYAPEKTIIWPLQGVYNRSSEGYAVYVWGRDNDTPGGVWILNEGKAIKLPAGSKTPPTEGINTYQLNLEWGTK